MLASVIHGSLSHSALHHHTVCGPCTLQGYLEHPTCRPKHRQKHWSHQKGAWHQDITLQASSAWLACWKHLKPSAECSEAAQRCCQPCGVMPTEGHHASRPFFPAALTEVAQLAAGVPTRARLRLDVCQKVMLQRLEQTEHSWETCTDRP